MAIHSKFVKREKEKVGSQVSGELPNILDIYSTGQQVEVFDHDKAEVAKLGNLRAGNSAVLMGNGKIAGKCARKTWLRQQGITYDSHSNDRLLMFSAGFASEDIWYDKLSKGWNGTILREEDIPVSWTTSGGTKVTGRPDMVLCSPAAEGEEPDTEVPRVVLEMKNVSSLWTARAVLFEETPKFDHLAQSGHYMWQLGVPGKLCYSLYLDMAVPSKSWIEKLFPRFGDKYSEHCDYSSEKKGRGIKKVKPFLRVYDLRWSGDGTAAHLQYRIEGTSGKWTTSPITVQGIIDYYEMIAELDIEAGSELPPRPLTLRGNGVKENYSLCNAEYCPLAESCDRHEDKPKEWLDSVRNLRWSTD